jgi:aspartokinase/homoserine dehydrogenase 1
MHVLTSGLTPAGTAAGEGTVPNEGGADAPISALPGSGRERHEPAGPRRGYSTAGTNVHIALAGPTGKVGRALLRLLGEQESWLRDERGIEISVVGAINTRNMAWNDRGIVPGNTIDDIRSGGPARWGEFSGRLASHKKAPLVFIDCTASELIAREYGTLLRSDVAIVTPNKIANTLEFAYYEELRNLGKRRGSRYLYETTVGAATPMLQVLRDLRRTGDTIHRVEGVLSGTLSSVFSSINRGEHFSSAVRQAVERGFTEPHPATDLSGEDVARKLLILAREAGYVLEREQVRVESLVPGGLEGIADPHEFLNRLADIDASWSARALRPAGRGNMLAYVARYDGTTASVGVEEVGRESPFVRLRASENAVHYYSDRHTPIPLTIQGIGAGPEVTARGVLADLIHTAVDLAA